MRTATTTPGTTATFLPCSSTVTGWRAESVRTDHVSFERIFDSDGTAVIIHAGPDNFANIPTRYSATGADAATLGTGDSGGRVVCGVVRR